MAEAQKIINTERGGEHYIDGCFKKPAVDLRYDSSQWGIFYPITSIDASSNTVSFECPYWAARSGMFIYFFFTLAKTI